MGTLVFQANLGGAVNLVGPNTASTVNFTLPSADGSSGQALVTNGSGTLSFSSFVSAAAGSNTQVQFNSSGAFAGSANLTFNGTTLTAANTSVTTSETLSYGTANGVAYLNGSKVVTTGSALTFDGTNFATTGSGTLKNLLLSGGTLPGAGNPSISLRSSDNVVYHQSGSANTIVMLDSAQNTMQSIGATAQIWNISNSEAMRLTSTGLGIGTSSPSYKLDVNGTSNFSGNMNLTATSNINWNGGDVAISNSGTNLIFKTYSSGSLSEKMRLDSSGNLGLGVTPSAWSTSVQTALQAYTAGVSGNGGGNTASRFTHGCYLDGSTWKYQYTGVAPTRYEVTGANAGSTHSWSIAAGGTAGNAITFTQAMTLDASGNLLVGTTSATYSASGRGLIEVNGSSTSLLALKTGGSAAGYLYHDGTALSLVNTKASYIQFTTNSIDAARIDSSGNFLIGKTATDDSTTGFAYRTAGYISVARNGGAPCYFNRTGTDGSVVEIANDGTTVGSISVSGSTTAYNTSSDYRLKHDIAPMTGALAKVAALKPVTYKWNADNSDGEGFIAHELAEVVPQCVTGEKDAVDAEGNPVYQGIDTSFLVATLTAAIQELKAEFDAYKATHP